MTAWPATVPIRDFTLTLNEAKASTESMFTRYRQVVSLSSGTADRWEAVVRTPPLNGTTLRTAWAFLVGVGMYGEITIGDPDYAGAQSGITTALVRGAAQSGTALICDGVSAGVTVLRAGEYFQVGNHFGCATADAVADGSGIFTINFKPSLRVAPSDNAAVNIMTPVIRMLLTSMPQKATDVDKYGVIEVALEEVL